MSYSASIHFKKANSDLEAFRFVELFQKALLNNKNLYDWLSLQKEAIKKDYLDCKKYKLTNGKHSLSRLFESFLQDILTVNFVYWPKYKLIGFIFTKDLPTGLYNLFDTYICFQNSCDQDYNFDTWNKLGSWALRLTDKFKSLSNRKIKIILKEDDDTDIDFNYWRRTLLYQEIYNKLDLDSLIYKKETSSFINIQSTKILTWMSYNLVANITEYLDKIMSNKENEF